MIEVFVHSTSVYMGTTRDTGPVEDADYLYVSSMQLKSECKFKDRIFPQDDHIVLERINELANKLHEDVKIYDTSRIQDRLRALKRGILKTPTVIAQGKKYQGLDKITQLLP